MNQDQPSPDQLKRLAFPERYANGDPEINRDVPKKPDRKAIMQLIAGVVIESQADYYDRIKAGEDTVGDGTGIVARATDAILAMLTHTREQALWDAEKAVLGVTEGKPGRVAKCAQEIQKLRPLVVSKGTDKDG